MIFQSKNICVHFAFHSDYTVIANLKRIAIYKLSREEASADGHLHNNEPPRGSGASEIHMSQSSLPGITSLGKSRENSLLVRFFLLPREALSHFRERCHSSE